MTLKRDCFLAVTLVLLAGCGLRPNGARDPIDPYCVETMDSFCRAIRDGRPSEVRKFLAAGVEVNAASDSRGRTPLMLAAEKKDNTAVIAILIRAGADVKAKDNDGLTAWDIARENDDPAAVAELEKAGARTGKKTYTSLRDAAAEGAAEDIGALVAGGADVNATNWDGMTPLMLAALKNENPEVVAALIRAGADVNVKIRNSLTPLHGAAAANKNREVIAALLAAGADVKARDKNGLTPLHGAAAANKNREVIAALLAAGADVNARDDIGWTPLMLAAWGNGNSKIVAALIEAGAEVNVRGDDGRTPLMLAAEKNDNPEVIATLIRAGADVKTRDNDGATALDYARKWGHAAAIVELEKTVAQ